jgi:hypothetical protein
VGLDDLIAALRPDGNAEDVVDRLRRASRRRMTGDNVTLAPDLHAPPNSVKHVRSAWTS